jgi:vanillate O-demethylase monooxygenase subunit
VLQWSGAVDAGTGARELGNRKGGFSLRIFHGLTPETENTCFYFYAPANGYRQDDPQATEQLFNQISEAFLEDKLICEGQQARIDELGEESLTDIVSDATRIQLRRIVARIAEAEAKPST